MYKVIRFVSKRNIDKIDCVKELVEELNALGDVAICDIDKTWDKEYGYLRLSAIITYYDFSEDN